MPTHLPHAELLTARPRRDLLLARAWREWCFARSILERLWLRLTILLVVLAAGALAFHQIDPENHPTAASSLYATYALIFANPVEDFPSHPLLQTLFFLVPIVGLTVIIEGIVETASLVRDRQRNERAWCRIMAESMRDHIILVGLGRLGYRTYTVLRRMASNVIVLELDGSNQFLSDVRRDGVPLFLGDARRESLLVDANVTEARAIILATTDDLANLEIALDARRLNPQIRVVLRMFDQNMADKIKDGFNIHQAMSQSALAAPAFAIAALERGIVASTVIDGRLVVTVAWQVRDGGPLDGKSVSQVLAQHGITIVRYLPASDTAGQAVLFPSPDVILQGGDQVHLQGVYERIREIGPGTQS